MSNIPVVSQAQTKSQNNAPINNKPVVDISPPNPKENTPKAVAEPILPPKKSNHGILFSFTLTYILLLTTATITIIEALRTPYPSARHVMNLETCISVIAGYFYSLFIQKVQNYNIEDKPIDWNELTQMRYIDWSITTPLMLLVLCLALGQTNGIKLHIHTYGYIVLLNYIMLFTGYLGETKVWSRLGSSIAGFIPFTLMFYLIYNTFVKPKKSMFNSVFFAIYVFIWALYGIVYLLGETYKNIAFNTLDLIAKCFVGLGLWAYFAKIIVI
jgi:bacteriorhodopsin